MCVWPWQQVTTRIKYHPFSLVAGGGVYKVLSSSQQDNHLFRREWGAIVQEEPLGSGEDSEVQTPVLVSRPELAEEGFRALL